MKVVVGLILCCLPVALHAQGAGALSKLDRLAQQAAASKLSIPVKIARSAWRPPTQLQRRFIQMEKTVHRPIPMTPPSALPVLSYNSYTEAQTRYEQVFTSFLNFKKEADIFLYYHAQMSTGTVLSGEETRQWLERIWQQKRQLSSLRGLIRVKEPSIISAYEYLNEVLHVVSPQTAPFEVPQPFSQRTDRVYNEEEFFLHTPKYSLVNHLMGLFEKKPRPSELPSGLNILVFNDNPLVIAQLIRWYQRGVFLPGQHVVFAEDANDALRLIKSGFITPDVILSDVISRHAMGGVGLAQELRNNKYNGAILALTGYQEQDVDGEWFLRAGFDGMISNPQGAVSTQLCSYLEKALQNYFYYRDLHGWQH